MHNFNLNNFLNKAFKFSQFNAQRNQSGSANSAQRETVHESFNQRQQNITPRLQQQSVAQNILNVQSRVMRNLQMNHLASLDRSVYIKNIMRMPKNLQEFLTEVQKEIAQTTKQAQTNLNAKTLNTNLSELLKQNLNLEDAAMFIQQNGKDALAKLIMAMASASQQGLEDMSEIETTMKLINACVSAAGEKDNAQTIKTLILLYLPWLPLQEGVGFELEVETYENESGDSETSLTILISTKNYDNLMITLVLSGTNNITILVNCSDKFPKEELLKRIKTESQTHAMQTSVSFEQREMKTDKQGENQAPQAKINMANTSEINPFLLLMAHAIIRHTIEIDRELN